MPAGVWPSPARSAIRSGRCSRWCSSATPLRMRDDLEEAMRLARQADQFPGDIAPEMARFSPHCC